eukprot:12899473-Prorocentrum_lima.AAC.1
MLSRTQVQKNKIALRVQDVMFPGLCVKCAFSQLGNVVLLQSHVHIYLAEATLHLLPSSSTWLLVCSDCVSNKDCQTRRYTDGNHQFREVGGRVVGRDKGCPMQCMITALP